jgi:LuxR family transcriptional regulator, maltose regulon positive regulatory protein
MSTPVLATKLYMPPPRPKVVLRPHLIERLNEGLRQNQGFGRKLTLISAAAGFGKTTLVSEWIAGCERRAAWLSLDEGDKDPARFLTYLVAALQTISTNIGEGVLAVLRASQPQAPSTESILTALLNEIAAIPGNFILVLDDYHLLGAKPVDDALTFLLDHQPPQMHLVIATREDPQLPLARLRARGHLTELRAVDLRFTAAEAADFLNQVMGLNLSAEDIAALETRTEGWIAGLQLAAVSMQGHPDTTRFIKSFTGSHRFVLDYLVEEVLQQQSESVQTFLLCTSILDRLCGSLCDAVCSCETDVVQGDDDLNPTPSASGQETLEYLEHANLFIVPLDNERRWYRYHHLFAELLRQRLHQNIASSAGDAESHVNELHIRASQWYEDNDLEIEAFHHAVAAHDVECAARLVEGKRMPQHFRDAVTAVLDWLESLPTTVLGARPSLWVRFASLLLRNGQTSGVEEKLQAAEAALRAQQGAETDDKTRDLVGQIAVARATLALARYQVEPMLVQSRRALEYLHPNNLSSRTTAHWTLGVAYFLQGDRPAARRAYTEAIALSQISGDGFATILATIGLGNVQEADNQLALAAETYQRVLQMLGDKPLPLAGEAHFSLARIYYEWNDLDAAQQHGQQSVQLARQFDRVIDRFVLCEVLLARLKLAQDDVAGAAALLAEAAQTVHQQNFVHRIPEVAAAQVLMLLRQGNLAAAAQLAQTHKLPISQARVCLAQGDPSAALEVLEPLRQQVEAKGWQDERLKVMVLQAVALHAHGEKDQAVQLLGEALALAEPGGFIRRFVDLGEPMRLLILDFRHLHRAADAVQVLRIEKQAHDESHQLIGYVDRLLAALARPAAMPPSKALAPVLRSGASADVSNLESTMIEPLSERELEILQLVARGFSNREIGERLFLAVSTVKGHNRNIFGKLQVQSRTEAIARARELGLL